MSLTKIDVAKMAIGHLGASQNIVSIDSPTSNAEKVVNTFFTSSLRTLLAEHEWGFATGFETLALVAEDPQGSWAYSYRPSTDVLVIRRIGTGLDFQHTEQQYDERENWLEVEDASGLLIYANVGDAEISYTKDIDPDSDFPNHFGKALSYQLAMDIAPSLITNNFAKVQNRLLQNVMQGINKGIEQDLNRKPAKKPSDSKYVRARMV